MKSIAAILFSVLTLAPAVARGQQAETLSSVKTEVSQSASCHYRV